MRSGTLAHLLFLFSKSNENGCIFKSLSLKRVMSNGPWLIDKYYRPGLFQTSSFFPCFVHRETESPTEGKPKVPGESIILIIFLFTFDNEIWSTSTDEVKRWFCVFDLSSVLSLHLLK